jgi:membrane associated rhomboid family serine protease
VTPWVLRIIIANGVIYLLELTMGQALLELLALYPVAVLSRPWTLITYMFLHDPRGIGHIFFNMLTLYFFGPAVEGRIGGSHFLRLYFISGLVGGLLSVIVTPHSPISIIGASGAVFGVSLAFAYYWPRQPIYIWGVFPIEARWLVVIMTVLSLGGAWMNTGGGVAHLAHLGGFAGGYLYLKYAERRAKASMRDFQTRMKTPAPKVETSSQALDRWRRINRDQLHEVNRAELDRVLDKISASGLASLTPAEREFLDRFSSRT